MSDNSPWQSPSGSTPAAEPAPFSPPASFSPPAQPSPPASFGGYGPPDPQQQPGAWTPPPRPGLIPLRPLGLGDILGSSFRVLRRNPRPIVGFALIIKGIVAIVTIAVVGVFTVEGLTHVLDVAGGSGATGAAGAAGTVDLGSLAQSAVSSVVTLTLGLVADAILQGIITIEVARGSLGEKLSIGALWGYARGRVLALVGWSALIGAVTLVATLLVAGVVTLLVVAGGTAGIVIGVLVGLIGGLAFAFFAVWLGVKLSIVASIIVLERRKLGGAIRRSWRLTGGFFWRTLGIELLVLVIISVASSIVLSPVSIVLALINFSTETSTGANPSDATTFITFTITTVLTAIVGALTAIISTAAFSLVYIDLRIRKEGLDLDLLRYTEQREAGMSDLANPYVTTQAAAAAHPGQAPAGPTLI